MCIRDRSNQCLHILVVNPTVQPTVESTLGPTVRPTVRSILKTYKCAIVLVGKLPVITGKPEIGGTLSCHQMLAFLLLPLYVNERILQDGFKWVYPNT